jgi:hypothetical protein
MKLILNFPCAIIGNKLEAAAGFEDRVLEIDNIVTLRYAHNSNEKKTGFCIIPKYPYSENASDNENTQARFDVYEKIKAATGWKESTDWVGQPCLFAEGGEVNGEFGIHAAGEFWVSYELYDEVLDAAVL